MIQTEISSSVFFSPILYAILLEKNVKDFLIQTIFEWKFTNVCVEVETLRLIDVRREKSFDNSTLSLYVIKKIERTENCLP